MYAYIYNKYSYIMNFSFYKSAENVLKFNVTF